MTWHIRWWLSGPGEERRAFQRPQKCARGRRAKGKHRERVAEGTVNLLSKFLFVIIIYLNLIFQG
jgi:hypothetical protein